jgi:PHP family Zn ribbon phosphoesterase
MLKPFKADLHIHTCLSPCTELDMSPTRILTAAKKKEIDIIGVCDHNSSENALAVMNAAKSMNISVFPGMEVTSQEEVHVVALFDKIENALKLQEYVYENLPGENDENAFGMQVIVNEKEEVLGSSDKLLIGATTIPLEKILQTIHSFDGIAIASHIDRESFSIIAQLGFIPDNLELDALEISPAITRDEAKKRYSDNYPITCSSDAHYPDDIGKAFTSFLLKDGTFAEVKKALKNEDGRKLIQ